MQWGCWVKLKKTTALASALRPMTDEHRLIPYIERFLVTHPYAGVYEVDDSQYVSKSKDRRHMHYHPSGDCLKCDRLLYFERDESVELLPDTPDAHLQCIFKVGNSLHAMIQAWFEAWNELAGFPTCVGNEVRIDDPRLNIGGYIDSVIRFPGAIHDTVVELKTINSYGFSRLSGPKPAHKMQMGCYMMSTGMPEAILLYINKDTAEFKEFLVPAFDMSPTVAKWAAVEDALEKGSMKGLQYGCKKGSREWSWCPARDICFRR